MQVLVIGAHPDDELIGCGGAIAKHVEKGDEVSILIFTRAYTPKWTKDYIKRQPLWQKSVDQFLKIKKRINLDFPTLWLNTIPHGELADAIFKVITEERPDIIYTHFEGDLNMDHHFVAVSTKVACRSFTNIKLLSYEIIVNTNNGNEAFKPNFYVALGKNHLSTKISAYKLYEVESDNAKRLPQKLENLAKLRGNEIGKNYAEAFTLIREVW